MKLTLYADGGSRGNPGPAAAGAVICDENGKAIVRLKSYIGQATNNQAEYAAVILGLGRAVELGATKIMIRLDSKLVVEQITGRWKVKDSDLKRAVDRAQALLMYFTDWSLEHIPREENGAADALVNSVLNARGYRKSLR